MKDLDKIPAWFLLASLATSIGVLYYMNAFDELACATRATFPYTVEGLKQRGHPVPPFVQGLADTIDAENKACWGDWDNPNLPHWTM